MSVIVFRDDERGYLDWLSKNSNGFVVNGRHELDPGYLVLHRADCKFIRRYVGIDKNPGGFTERGYVKICSTSLPGLEKYLKTMVKRRPPFSKECGFCRPI